MNTGANIVLMTGNLGKPMDIHAYSAIPKQRKCVYYILQQYNPESILHEAVMVCVELPEKDISNI